METFTIHIKTDGRHLAAFKRLAQAVGATITTEIADHNLSLEKIIGAGEDAIQAGQGITLTPDELKALVGNAA
ncbi:hypothetical protein GCM10027299_01920 [Larkinella ripae]